MGWERVVDFSIIIDNIRRGIWAMNYESAAVE